VRIRLGNLLLPVIAVSAVLILVISFLPDITALRVILGLPFILFFPGYVLVLALFPGKDAMGSMERLALSFGLSFAVTALIGLGLNYTPWGIRLMPVLYSQSVFIVLMSAVAFWRQSRMPAAERFSVGWETGFSHGTGKLDRALSVILGITILTTIGVLIYTVAFPRVGEKFTEFYILGTEGQAAGYPRDFALSAGKVVAVGYGDGETQPGTSGNVIVGIINREQTATTYEVSLLINGLTVPMVVDGATVDTLGPISLVNDEKFEKEIGFAPSQPGDDQKVEFVLLVGGKPYFDSPPHLWINAGVSQ
jgi:uncharacterized membrane protein